MEIASSATHKRIHIISGIFILLGLYLTSLYSYLLFHSLVEIFSIIVACGIFMIAWNFNNLSLSFMFLQIRPSAPSYKDKVLHGQGILYL